VNSPGERAKPVKTAGNVAEIRSEYMLNTRL